MQSNNAHHLLSLCMLAVVSAQFSSIPFGERAEHLSTRLRESEFGTLREPHVLVQAGLKKLREENLTEPFVEYGLANASQVAEEVASELTRLFANRKAALLASVREAEEIVLNHTTVTKMENVDTYFSLDIKENNWKVPTNMTTMPEFRCEVFEPASTAYITRDVYYKVPQVVNGVAWTTHLDKIWKENREKFNVTGWQYFGSRHGFIRVYPGYKWSYVEGEENNNYNPAYDIRRFPWYQQGVTSPKDVLILVDTSGSVYGQPLQYMKIAASSFIETLNENDYVNIMTFSQFAQLVTPKIKTFVPANERNKKMLKRYLDSVAPLNQAEYDAAFETAFSLFDGDVFGNSSEFLRNGFGANCNQIILLLTDGGSEFPEEMFRKFNWNRRTLQSGSGTQWINKSSEEIPDELQFSRAQRRVFTFALGQQQNPTSGLRRIACANRGYFKHILDIGSIKSVLEKYVEVLQRPLLEKMETPVSFSNRYYEQDGMGYVVSILAPVYNRTHDKEDFGFAPSSVLGLMANDISLAQIVNDTVEPLSRQLGTNGYVFIINQNGFVVLHPSLQPMDDLTVISGGNIKDRQVNDGVDILDLEFDDSARQDIRRRMIDGESGSVTLYDVAMRCTHNNTAVFRATVTYSFAPIRDTPFSVGVVVHHSSLIRRKVSFASDTADSATSERYEAALRRLLQRAVEALQLPLGTTNETVVTHHHSLVIPTQIAFCSSLPTAPWTTKVPESSTDTGTPAGSPAGSAKSDGESNVTMPEMTSPVMTYQQTSESDDKYVQISTEFLNATPTEVPTYSTSVAGETDSIGSSTDPSALAGRDEESYAFLRFVYAHFDGFFERLVNATNDVQRYVSDCGTPETLQLLVDASVLHLVITDWVNTAESESESSTDDVPRISEGVLSKVLISAHALATGHPKTRFDEYLARSLFSPYARQNSLFESVSLADIANSTNETHYHMHFEVLRTAGETPYLFAITPLRIPIPGTALREPYDKGTFPTYVLGIAAIEVNTSYLDALFESTVPECHAEALCYLVDHLGYIIATSALASRTAPQLGAVVNTSETTPASLIGMTLLEVNSPLFLAMLHDGIFERTNFYFTQEKCDTPSQYVSASGANSPFSFAFWSRLFSAISMHLSQMLSYSFWTDSFASLFTGSPHPLYFDMADAAGPSKGRKGGRKSKKRGGAAAQQQTEEEDERRCVLNVTRFMVNDTALEQGGSGSGRLHTFGKFRCDANCEKGYAIAHVPHTSLYLIMTATNFACALVRHSHAQSPVETDGDNETENTTAGAPVTTTTINFTVDSFDADCGLVNGKTNNTILQFDDDHMESSLESGIRLENEVKLGDSEYASRMRKRYRRRPAACYDYWIDEDPTCRATLLFSNLFNVLACAFSLITLLISSR